MSSQNEATHIRQLIAENQNKVAAERLYEWFEGKSAGRQDAALALLNRITALEHNVLGGLIAQADADLERNRITKALLELSKQLDATDEVTDAPVPMSKAWIFGVLAIAVAGMLYLSLYKGGAPARPAEFDVTVQLHGPGGASEPITAGKIILTLGDYNLPPKDINSNGQVIFDEIPGKYFDQPLRVAPIGIRYKVLSQTAQTARESQSITFTLAPLPDTTLVRGIVFLPGAGNKPAVGAELDFDAGRGQGVTDEKGRFQVAVPAAAGKSINLRIDYMKQNRYNRNVTISATELLPITLNP